MWNGWTSGWAHSRIDRPRLYLSVSNQSGWPVNSCLTISVMRELLKQPSVLREEATSDLDTASEQHIQSSVDALQGEVTVVIIAHRLLTVKKADRVYVLDEGRVIEEGSYDELRHREEGVFREMVEMQSL